MRAALATVLLLAVAAAGSDQTGDVEEDSQVCVEAELRRVTITPDKLPVALLATTRLLREIGPQPQPGWEWESWARELLDTHQDIQSVAQLSRWSVSISYREDDGIPPGNATSPSYLRSLEGALNRSSAGFWAPPFWDCYLSKWVFGFTTPLHGNRKTAGLFFSLDWVDLNQCDEVNSPIFGGTHNCDPQSTKCLPIHGFGTRRGGYRCACLPGFVPPPAANTTVHDQYGATFYRCVPSCGEGKQCSAEVDLFLRTFILAAQSFCIVVTVVLAVVVFRKRKCKTIAAGMWTILETILLGILLLYASVIVHSFSPSIERCLFEPWFRELGFIVCYGAIILKLYRPRHDKRKTTAVRSGHTDQARDQLDVAARLPSAVIEQRALPTAKSATRSSKVERGVSDGRISRAIKNKDNSITPPKDKRGQGKAPKNKTPDHRLQKVKDFIITDSCRKCDACNIKLKSLPETEQRPVKIEQELHWRLAESARTGYRVDAEKGKDPSNDVSVIAFDLMKHCQHLCYPQGQFITNGSCGRIV
ncbi:hypothetical protein J6590_097049 [Homalodisca vitripennis]|nr:hypothetical protein J6590_097049 [Homalodisca vitripennis]